VAAAACQRETAPVRSAPQTPRLTARISRFAGLAEQRGIWPHACVLALGQLCSALRRGVAPSLHCADARQQGLVALRQSSRLCSAKRAYLRELGTFAATAAPAATSWRARFPARAAGPDALRPRAHGVEVTKGLHVAQCRTRARRLQLRPQLRVDDCSVADAAVALAELRLQRAYWNTDGSSHTQARTCRCRICSALLSRARAASSSARSLATRSASTLHASREDFDRREREVTVRSSAHTSGSACRARPESVPFWSPWQKSASGSAVPAFPGATDGRGRQAGSSVSPNGRFGGREARAAADQRLANGCFLSGHVLLRLDTRGGGGLPQARHFGLRLCQVLRITGCAMELAQHKECRARPLACEQQCRRASLHACVRLWLHAPL
jgi:hypothetical protein